MNKKNVLLILSLGILLFATGCQGKKRPQGFPKLYPASISVTQEGAPLDEAMLVLYSADGSLPWIVSGITNKEGLAKLVTHGEYPGAPLGEFKVCVAKYYRDPVDPEPVNPTDWKVWAKKMQENPPKQYLLVEEVYGETETTPLRVKIESGGKNHFDLDVGHSVRIKLD